MKCPYHKLKETLLPLLTRRVATLPVAENSYPVPYFVKWIDGKPDFRVVDPDKLVSCINQRLCWICGESMGAYKSFVVGPMGYVNRISSDAHMHFDCADFSVKACPFLINPNAKRREDEMTEAGKHAVGGHLVEENPGIMCVYTTKTYQVKLVGKGPLFFLGEIDSATWWAQGRLATAQEIEHAFAVGCVRATQHCDEKERESFRLKVRGELERVLQGLT